MCNLLKEGAIGASVRSSTTISMQVDNNCTIAHSHLCQRKDNFCARVIGQKYKKSLIAQWHKIAKTAPIKKLCCMSSILCYALWG